jgi:murein DD-endopeptidase MepM/ murein hydrolase activator NlpD
MDRAHAKVRVLALGVSYPAPQIAEQLVACHHEQIGPKRRLAPETIPALDTREKGSLNEILDLLGRGLVAKETPDGGEVSVEESVAGVGISLSPLLQELQVGIHGRRHAITRPLGLQMEAIVRSVRASMASIRSARLGLIFAALAACERADPPSVDHIESARPASAGADAAGTSAQDGQTEATGPEHDAADAADAAEPEATPPDPWTRGTVSSGDSLSEILAGVGLDAATAHGVITAMATRMDPAKIKVGQAWAARFEDGILVRFEYESSRSEKVVVEPDDNGTFVAQTIVAETETVVTEISGTIESSLWNAVTATGETGALVPLLVDVLAANIDFYTDTRKDDRFAVVVEKELLEGELLRYARVLAVEYRGAVGHFAGAWWVPPDSSSGGYFDAEGNSLGRVLLKSPLKFTRVSSQFNPKRMHPVLHRVKGHFGTDYAAPEGTPVWAAADGRIVFRAAKGGAGNMVILSHDGGLKTLYMHLSRFEEGQKVGDRVGQKTVIGYVGQTGLATGPHLHFGLQRHGKYIDPEEIKSVPRPGVPRKHRARFLQETRPLLERLHRAAENDDPNEGEAPATASAEGTTTGAGPQ